MTLVSERPSAEWAVPQWGLGHGCFHLAAWMHSAAFTPTQSCPLVIRSHETDVNALNMSLVSFWTLNSGGHSRKVITSSFLHMHNVVMMIFSKVLSKSCHSSCLGCTVLAPQLILNFKILLPTSQSSFIPFYLWYKAHKTFTTNVCSNTACLPGAVSSFVDSFKNVLKPWLIQRAFELV